MCIAVHIVQPEGVPAPREPNNAHEPSAQHRRDHGDTASAHNDGEEAVAIGVGIGKQDLTTSLADDPKDGAPFPDTSLLDQGNIPAKGSQVGPTLCKAGEVGRDNVWPGMSGLTDAIMAPTIGAKGAGMPRGNPGHPPVEPKRGAAHHEQ